MKEFNYKVVHTMDKDEYDKNIFEFTKKEPMLAWLLNNVGPGGILFDENAMWYDTHEYPGPRLISTVYHFKNQNDAMMFALKYGS